MAGDHLTTQPAQAQLDAYCRDLAARLRGPGRRREQILAELRDGLDHAVEDRIAHGLTDTEAARAAITEFGTPDAVAAAFAGELATAYARRTIALFILTGPLVGIWWLLLLQPNPWRTGLIALLVAIPVLPLLPIAIATAAAALATTGRLIRWLPETSPRQAVTATIAIAGAVLLADLTVLAVYAGSNIPAQPLAALAIAASLLRITGSIITLRHATAIRHDLSATSTEGPVSTG